MRPIKIDRQLFHEYLWLLADRHHILKINVSEISDDLGVHRMTISRIVAEFVEDKRITFIKETGWRIGQYEISDPADFKLPPNS